MSQSRRSLPKIGVGIVLAVLCGPVVVPGQVVSSRGAKAPLVTDVLPLAGGQGVQPSRPNIILMMADDMGWADMDFPVRLGLNSSGNEVIYNGTPHWATPNLASMAANSLTFSRMYSQSPVCSPTRASILTGRAPERIGVDFAGVGKLENREVTIVEYAQSLGYATIHLGKWHLGSLTRDVLDANNGGPGSFGVYSTPLNSGFDEMYSTESKVSTYDPGTSGLTTATRYWTGPGVFVPLNSPTIAGDSSAIVARETNSFMEQAVNAGEPFLIVSWFHTPHLPTNTPGNTNTNNLASYKYAMEDLDRAVGSIRAKVQQLGIADNTIIMFTSDNGPEDGQDYNTEGLRDNKRELYEGGVREPGMIEWPSRITPGVTHTPMVTSDYLPTLLEIWGIDPVDSRPLDGQSMVETIFNDRIADRQKTIVTKSTNGHQSAMGVGGRYKLISTNNGGLWTLYDIVMDYDENNPLANSSNIGSQPQVIQDIYAELLADYIAWAGSVANSVSGSISGDYETRIASSNNLNLQKEPTENLKDGDVTSSQAKLYLERQYATLRQSLTMDSDGSLGQHNINGSATLTTGTVVHSYLAHFDPTITSGSTVNYSITFEDKILGVIGEQPLLAASDGLSFADPNFDTVITRGMDPADNWTISNDGYTITVSSTVSTGLDQVRILTESSLQNVSLATKINAYMAYGGSSFGDTIASDKIPLLDGEVAGLAHYSNYSLGINRVIVDIANLPNNGADISAADFVFRMGNNNAPGNWIDAPVPTDVSVVPNGGIDDSDRVTITWNDQAIKNTWLQATVLWNANTGLLDDEVFYFGHAAFEGNSPSGNVLVVDFLDSIGAFLNQTPVDLAAITNTYDYDRNGTVNFVDAIGAFLNQNGEVLLIDLTTP